MYHSNNTSSYSNVLKPTPSKKQAILIPSDPDTNLIEYVVGLGRIISPQNILSASKISKNRICIYLDSENTVEAFIKTGGKITVNDMTVTARRLVSPSKKIILSNVHTCLPNSVILEALRDINIKTCSAIHNLHIGTFTSTISEEELLHYKHITSFRRGVYIEEENTTLPSSLLINFENESYRIFINDGDLKCHHCGGSSHNAEQCQKTDQQSNTETLRVDEQPNTNSLSFEEQLILARNIRDDSPKPESSGQTNMDITFTSTKRSLPKSLDLNSSSPSQPDTGKKPKKKKRKTKSKTENPRTENEKSISSSPSDAETDDHESTNEENQNGNDPLNLNTTASIIEYLKPAASIFENEENRQLPLQDFAEFIRQCEKPKNAPIAVQEYAKDIPELINLIDQCHTEIKNRNLKTRLTRTKNALSPKERTLPLKAP